MEGWGAGQRNSEELDSLAEGKFKALSSSPFFFPINTFIPHNYSLKCPGPSQRQTMAVLPTTHLTLLQNIPVGQSARGHLPAATRKMGMRFLGQSRSKGGPLREETKQGDGGREGRREGESGRERGKWKKIKKDERKYGERRGRAEQPPHFCSGPQEARGSEAPR